MMADPNSPTVPVVGDVSGVSLGRTDPEIHHEADLNDLTVWANSIVETLRDGLIRALEAAADPAEADEVRAWIASMAEYIAGAAQPVSVVATSIELALETGGGGGKISLIGSPADPLVDFSPIWRRLSRRERRAAKRTARRLGANTAWRAKMDESERDT